MIKTKTMPSGLRFAVNSMKGFEGVSFKMFVFTGSSNESDEKDFGISHLIEHMLFKGTKTRSSVELLKELDGLGIQSNAFTSTDETCYYTYSTLFGLEKCVEILSDMLFNSTFDEIELEKEKAVVIEEIKMYQDKFDAVCEMEMNSIFYENTNYAHDIAGSEEIVKNISREQILEYMKKYYTPNNIILSFAGNVTIEKAEELVLKYFEPNFKIHKQFEFLPHKQNFKVKKRAEIVKKDTNQAQLMIAYACDNQYNRKILPINNLISIMLGGAMTSRLYQQVREKLGLVYYINSSNDVNKFAGMFSISFGTSLKNVEKALKTIKKEIDEVCKNGFSEEELLKAKNIAISSTKLNNDSPSRQASRLAYQLQYVNKIVNKNQLINRCEKITLEEVNKEAKKLFSKNFCITMVGNDDKLDLLELYK